MVPPRVGNRTDRVIIGFFGIQYRHPIPRFSEFRYPFRIRNGSENLEFQNFKLQYVFSERSDFQNFRSEFSEFQNF